MSERTSDNGGGEAKWRAPQTNNSIALAAKSDYCSAYRRYIKCVLDQVAEERSARARESIRVRGLSLKINVK